MAVNYRNSLKRTRMTDVLNDIDSGMGAGKLKLLTAADAVIVSINMNDPCGTISGVGVDPVVLTINATGMSAAASLAGTNTAAKAIVTDSADNTIVSGLTVGTTGSGADVELNSTSITSGQTVTITSATITHA